MCRVFVPSEINPLIQTQVPVLTPVAAVSHPCLIHISTSTFCLCPNADPSRHLLLCSENPSSTPSCSPPSVAANSDWGHLQAGVKQIRTSPKSISCLPLRLGGMCSVSPVYPVRVSADGCSCHWHSGCWWNGIIYLSSSLLLSPEGRSARMCTGLLFIAGLCSK